MEECHKRVRNVEAHMVADFTATERRQLAGLLERCAENLVRRRAPASRRLELGTY